MKKLLVALLTSAFALGAFAQTPKSDTAPKASTSAEKKDEKKAAKAKAKADKKSAKAKAKADKKAETK
jgi:hypothetical protein